MFLSCVYITIPKSSPRTQTNRPPSSRLCPVMPKNVTSGFDRFGSTRSASLAEAGTAVRMANSAISPRIGSRLKDRPIRARGLGLDIIPPKKPWAIPAIHSASRDPAMGRAEGRRADGFGAFRPPWRSLRLHAQGGADPDPPGRSGGRYHNWGENRMGRFG